MVKTISKFIPTVVSLLFWVGLQMSGIAIPWLGYLLMGLAVLLLLIPGWPLIKRILPMLAKVHTRQREPLKLIDSFPKDNEVITTEDVKKIFLKFDKPIDKQTAKYISNYYIRRNSRCQWNICGWIQFSENDSKLIWHVHERLLQNKDEYGPMDIDYPTFEIRIGLTKNWRVKAIDGSELPETIIRVKIKPDALPSQLEGTQITAPIEDEPEISIEIDKCSVSSYGQSDQAIEVALTLNVKSPPVNIADLQLYMGDEMLKLLSPTMPITQRNNKECYIARYKLSLTTIYKVGKNSRDKYHIRVVTKRQEVDSEVFSINNP